MKQGFKYLLLSAFGATTVLAGCDKALDIAPRQSIAAETALTTREGINAAVVSVYARMKSARLYGRDLIAIPEALADNGYATNKSGRLLPESNNSNRAHFGDGLFQLSYQNINEANLILEAVGANAALSAAEKASIEGQMYFVRGLNLFNVAIAYAYIPGAVVAANDKGGVPIVTTGINTTEGALAAQPRRAPIDSVYMQIVSDLTAANSRLTGSTGLPNVANRPAAQAMLSRVNLYRKNYTEAKRWADSAVATAGTRLTSGAAYVSGWRAATHPETLFQVVYNTNGENIGVNESLQTSFTTLVTLGGATTGGFGDLVPSLYLLNELGITLTGGNTVTNYRTNNSTIASRTADVRNQLYEPGTTGRGKQYVEVTKYLGKNGFINLDNVPVIRIAEVYLNRAEAMATPGSAVFNEAAALTDLNRILVARGLPEVNLAGQALYDEILRQRRLELAFEGHRFWDLKRLGRDLIKAPLYSGGDVLFTDPRILAPLPTREVGPGFPQNTGY